MHENPQIYQFSNKSDKFSISENLKKNQIENARIPEKNVVTIKFYILKLKNLPCYIKEIQLDYLLESSSIPFEEIVSTKLIDNADNKSISYELIFNLKENANRAYDKLSKVIIDKKKLEMDIYEKDRL